MTTTHRSPGTRCAPPPAALTGTASGLSPPSTTAPYLPVSSSRGLIHANYPLPPPLLMRRHVCALARFRTQGSLSLPRRDGRDEEPRLHRTQPSRSHQQLRVGRLPDLSPAHPHQVLSFPQTPIFPGFSFVLRVNNLVFVVGSPQHQGRLSLDLSQQKRANDYSESTSSRSSRASHGTNSLPSSARLGQSDTHARTQHARTHARTETAVASVPGYPDTASQACRLFACRFF